MDPRLADIRRVRILGDPPSPVPIPLPELGANNCVAYPANLNKVNMARPWGLTPGGVPSDRVGRVGSKSAEMVAVDVARHDTALPMSTNNYMEQDVITTNSHINIAVSNLLSDPYATGIQYKRPSNHQPTRTRTTRARRKKVSTTNGTDAKPRSQVCTSVSENKMARRKTSKLSRVLYARLWPLRVSERGQVPPGGQETSAARVCGG